MMAEGGTTPRACMGIPMHLAGHQTIEADLLHDNAFAGFLGRISDDRVQDRLHQRHAGYGRILHHAAKVLGNSNTFDRPSGGRDKLAA